MNLRTYVYGIMTGIFIMVACFTAASVVAGVKWKPVFAAQPTPDQLYGCTLRQQAPNGECQ